MALIILHEAEPDSFFLFKIESQERTREKGKRDKKWQREKEKWRFNLETQNCVWPKLY